jgi:hypothetical protein
MVMPTTTNAAFIKLWNGEQTYRPFQVPQAVFPRSLIVSRDLSALSWTTDEDDGYAQP